MVVSVTKEADGSRIILFDTGFTKRVTLDEAILLASDQSAAADFLRRWRQ